MADKLMNRQRMLHLAIFAVYVVAAGVGAGGEEPIRDVTYVEREGRPLKADVYLPPGSGPFPGVLLVHGGAWRSGRKGQMIAYGQDLAAAGLVAVSIDYRLAPEHTFPAQIEDCKSAVRWMRASAATYKIDPYRVGAMGYSAGGHLVALLGTTDPTCGLEGPDADGTSTRVHCVVAGGAPCDFRLIPKDLDNFAYWLGGTRGQKPQAYESASPLKFASRDDPPMLFIHGDADRLVPLRGPRRMISQLTDLGVPTRLYLVPGAGHVQAFTDEGARREAVKFFEEFFINSNKKK